MTQKITVRFGLFLIVIFLLPLIFIIKSPYDYYISYKRPIVSERGDSYRICTSRGCSQFPKEVIDNLEFSPSDFDIKSGGYLNITERSINDPDFKFNFVHFDIGSKYYQKLNSAILEKDLAKRSFYFYMSICSIYLFAFLFLLFKNQITLIGNVINIKSGWVKKTNFNIDSVEEIKIITTTPLIAGRTNIDQVNWRDVAGVYYRSLEGRIDKVVVSLFIFPGFKKIIKEVIKRKPGVKITFNKRTLKENITH